MEIIAGTIPEAYHKALLAMSRTGKQVQSEDWGTACMELTNVMLEVSYPLAEPRISLIGIHTPDSLESYVNELCDGTFDWAYYCGKEAYTYHERFSEQLKKAINILREKPTSRRAVISVRRESDIEVNDQPCLTTIQLLIRKSRLHMTAYFRSNDLAKATFMNMHALVELQKRIADELGLPVGVYTHIVGSLHVYKRDYDTLFRAAERIGKGEKCVIATEEWEKFK